MTLDEIFSYFNPSRMRNQLTELNIAPYGYGTNSPIQPQLVSMKEEYKNAHLLSYAEKLDLLLEAQETGRPEIQDHVFEQCRTIQRRFFAKIQDLERSLLGPVKDMICRECDEVKRERDGVLSACELVKKECARLTTAHEGIQSEISKVRNDLSNLQEKYESEGKESVRILGEASAEIKLGKDEVAGLGNQLLETRRELEKQLLETRQELEKQLLETRRELEKLMLYKAKELEYEKNYEGAEEAYHMLIHLRRQILNSADATTDDSVDDATVLDYRYIETEMQLKQGEPKHPIAEINAHALYEKKKVLPGEGEDAAETRKSFRQWCTTLRCQSMEKKCRAEQIYREIWFFKTGTDDKLWRMENGFELAAVLTERGEKGDAKSQYRRVWEKRNDAVEGADAVRFKEIACASGHQLGSLLYEEKNYKAAVDRLVEVWEARKTVLPEYHKDTIQTAELLLKAYNNVKESLKEEDKEEALNLWTWMAYKEVGQDSTKIQEALYRVAKLQLKRSKFDASAASFKGLWGARRTTLGPKNPQTLDASYFHCFSLVEQQKYSEAKPLIRDNWEARKEVLTQQAENIQTLSSGHLYGQVLARLGVPDYAEAERVLREVWTTRKRVLPLKEDDPQTLNTAHEYGFVLLENKEVPENPNKITEARSILEHTWKAREKMLGAAHEKTLETGQQYAIARLEQHDLTGLDNVIRGIYEARLRILGPNDGRTLDSGLTYGTVVLQIADGINSPPHKEAGRKQGIEILRRLWNGRQELWTSGQAMAQRVMLDVGFSLAVALVDGGGPGLEEARGVIEEVIRRVPQGRVKIAGVDPVGAMKDEIQRRWEEWEGWKKSPGLRPKEEKVEGKGRGKELEIIPEYKGSTRSTRKGKDDLKFFKHFAKNW